MTSRRRQRPWTAGKLFKQFFTGYTTPVTRPGCEDNAVLSVAQWTHLHNATTRQAGLIAPPFWKSALTNF